MGNDIFSETEYKPTYSRITNKLSNFDILRIKENNISTKLKTNWWEVDKLRECFDNLLESIIKRVSA